MNIISICYYENMKIRKYQKYITKAGEYFDMKRILSIGLIICLMLSINLSYSAQGADSDVNIEGEDVIVSNDDFQSSAIGNEIQVSENAEPNVQTANNLLPTTTEGENLLVHNEDELVMALADEKIQSVTMGNDIEVSKSTTLYINGDQKFINGNNHVLTITSGDISITSNVKIDGFENVEIKSANNIYLILNYGGHIDHLHGDKIVIESNSYLEVYRSSLAYVKIINGYGSKIVESEINGQGIYLDNSYGISIDKVNINLGDTYNNGIVLSGRTSADISNTVISGGGYGIYSYMNGMSANITNTKISGSKNNGIYNNGDVNGSHLVLSNVEISDTGSYGIFNTGTYAQGSITITAETDLTLNTGNHIGIYQEYGYLNILGEVFHNGSQYTLFSNSNSAINDPNGMMELKHQNSSIFLYNSIHRTGDEVVLTSVNVKNEEELRNALLDEKVNTVQLDNDIEIINLSAIEVKGILKKISGGNFQLVFNDSMNPQITSNEYIEIENLTINHNLSGVLSLNKGGTLSNFHSPKIRVDSIGETQVISSEVEGISVNNGNNSKIINSTIGTYGIYLYLCQNTTIDKVNIILGDTYSYGIVLSGRTSADITNTVISGGSYGIYSYMNGMSSNIANTKISGSKNNGIYNNGDVNGSHLVLSNVEISDTGSYGIFNTGTNAQGSITIAAETDLTLNTGNHIGIYQEYGYLNILGEVFHTGSQYTLLSNSNSAINDPNGMMELKHQNSSIFLYNSIHRTGDEVVLTAANVKNEEELRDALLDEKVNTVQLSNDIEISNSATIEVKGILKKLSGGNFQLLFSDRVNPQIVANDFFEIENLTINDNLSGILSLNKGGILSNFHSPKIRVDSIGETQVISSEVEGVSINNGTHSKVINSTIGTNGIYLYLCQNTIIDKVDIILGDTYNYGIVLSGRTSADISNTVISGGGYGIYSYMNGMSSNILNTKISGSKYNGIYNNGTVNGSRLVLSNVELSDTGGYGIYNTGGYSQGSIMITPKTTLTLNTGNNIGIFQENGSLELYGNINSTKSGIIISSDYKSYTYDYNNQLIWLNPTTDSYKNYVLKEKIYAEKIVLTGANNETSVGINKTLQMSASVSPTDATDSSVTWSVENGTGKAMISPTGELTGLRAGTITVKATANDGSGVFGTILINIVIQVSFNSQGGSEVPVVLVEEDASLLSVPEEPTKIGYTFGGWYKEADCLNEWNFENDRVTNDTILYAKWNTNSYTVSFNTFGGTIVPYIITNYDSLITSPPEPRRMGFTFAGWYKDNSLITTWNFESDTITNNTTLYAKWIVNPSVPRAIKSESLSYNTMNVSWGAVTGVSGYEIYRATSISGKYSLISKTSIPQHRDTGLETNTVYFYKVRAYISIGSTKVYSNWSPVTYTRL
jgi:uncharacterized repeat protein (TIGR02543 family)